ncbi:hypothetical protein FPZ42_06615 [Mucilaginibacter achroorhodeus]|uniref:Uncharacterized protein n=2 Tax=Mucilaginibacter achroorhodeus TaxID=2599294 RepID=A0A563U7N0_9SPHI|nr:hypothetical protein FPZ42_06615 [Mucilaginibacter achroorhodeus]
MQQVTCTRETAEAANCNFNLEVQSFLRKWVIRYQTEMPLRFDQSLEEYLSNNALRDFFLHSAHPLKQLLQEGCIARHLVRGIDHVHFDPVSGDPLFATAEQRIYNLAHRIDSENMHVPFRSVQPAKQTEAGDIADISTYPPESDRLRYNSGNHFASRPANNNVFEENSKKCVVKSAGNVHVVFEKGYLEERLHEVKQWMVEINHTGVDTCQYFVICSRHSPKEGHFGASLLIMDPVNPHFPIRVYVCDTLLKDLPHHPRWWNHFITEYSNVFGDAIGEVIEDLSHPLQKVNVKSDMPYRHDWDCPYYVTSMTEALADLSLADPYLLASGSLKEVHDAMKILMPDYYLADQSIKERGEIKFVNLMKRWNSGVKVIRDLLTDVRDNLSLEL